MSRVSSLGQGFIFFLSFYAGCGAHPLGTGVLFFRAKETSLLFIIRAPPQFKV
jgi:hypothetical protein